MTGLRQAFEELGLFAQIGKVENCGKELINLACGQCKNYRSIVNRCKSKVCLPCSKTRAFRFLAQYLPYLRSFERPRLMTLTMKNIEFPSRNEYRRLTKAFNALKKRLKRSGYYLDKGIIVKETTERGNGFHIHLHILYDGSYIPQALLADHWEAITKDSRVVDIRFVRNPEASLRYLAKYIAKGFSMERPESIAIFFRETAHIRMVQTFGKNFEIRKINIMKRCPNGCIFTRWIYVEDVTGLKSFPDQQRRLDKPPDLEVSYDHRLLKRISHVVDKPSNIDKIMEILQPEELRHMLSNGLIFRSRHDEYRLL